MARRSGRKKVSVMPAALIADTQQLEQLARNGSNAAANYLLAAHKMTASIEAYMRGDSATAILRAAEAREIPDGQYMFKSYGYKDYFEFINNACMKNMRSDSGAPTTLRRACYLVASHTLMMCGVHPARVGEVVELGLQLYPHYAPLWQAAADINAMLSKWTLCMKCLNSVVDLHQGREDPMSLHDKAMCYMQQARYDCCLEACEQYLNMDTVGFRLTPITHFVKAFVLIQRLSKVERTPENLLPALEAYHDGVRALRERLPMLSDDAPFHAVVSQMLHDAKLLKREHVAPGTRLSYSDPQVETMLQHLGATQIAMLDRGRSGSQQSRANRPPSSTDSAALQRKALKNQKKYQKKKEKKLKQLQETETQGAEFESTTGGATETVEQNNTRTTVNQATCGDGAQERTVVSRGADEEEDDDDLCDMPGLIPGDEGNVQTRSESEQGQSASATEACEGQEESGVGEVTAGMEQLCVNGRSATAEGLPEVD